MAAQFTREHLKICVAKMCITIGWHTSMTTPIEILTDILCNYLFQLGKSSKDYANEFGRTDPNINDLALVFREFHINLPDLEEYVKYVNFADQPHAVPKYPLPKEDHLNFLKPGSKEVVTRPVHIHEHLPPMYPLDEVDENDTSIANNSESNEDKPSVEAFNAVFKRPSEILQNESFKRPRLLLEDEGRPTREISSVMMTTSGFLSPAREGKLPESRTPISTLEPTLSPPTVSPAPPENSPLTTKKPTKIFKVAEKKKDKIIKDSIKGSNDHGSVRKVTNVKDFIKNKMKVGSTSNNSNANNFTLMNDVNISLISNSKVNSPNRTKFNKALAAARLKTEKLNTTITPIVPKLSVMQMNKQMKIEPHVDKLFTEPDKKKVNIFKKISVKNEKLEKSVKTKSEVKQESRESSPDLIIDESVNEINNKVHHLSNDITIELINSAPSTKSPEKNEQSYFDDDSPPGTPSTPKTPEMISQSPPLKAEKQKRKDKSKVKKFQRPISPPRMSNENEDYVDVVNVMDDNMERPKTPEAELILHQEDRRDYPASLSPRRLSFFRNLPGPGLIPPPLGNPLFPHLPIPALGIPAFGQPPFIPPSLPLHLMPPLKSEDLMSRLPTMPSTMHPLIPDISRPPPPPTPAPTPPRIPVPPRVRTPVSLPVSLPSMTLPVMSTPLQTPATTTIPSALISTIISPSIPSPSPVPVPSSALSLLPKIEKKSREHKKEKKDKTKKKNKKDKIKSKAEKKKLKEERKDKFKKEKREKKKEKEIRNSEGAVPKLTLKLGCNSPLTESSETKKLNIKPIIKKDEPPVATEVNREMSPELAKISALVTGQPKLKIISTPSTSSHATDPYPTSSNDSFNMKKINKPIVLTKQRKETYKEPTSAVLTNNNTASSSYIDAEGNKVWICPACGKQDDGSPMIGCDDCDAWYHWVCVGIQVPPDDSEDWYCRFCISKKQEVLQTDKKKKRKRRDKKDY